MNEQSPDNQEDGGGEMQLANVAPVAKRRIQSIQEEHKVPREMERQVFLLYCMMGLAHFVLLYKAVNCFKQVN